jgi:hypothetical protein
MGALIAEAITRLAEVVVQMLNPTLRVLFWQRIADLCMCVRRVQESRRYLSVIWLRGSDLYRISHFVSQRTASGTTYLVLGDLNATPSSSVVTVYNNNIISGDLALACAYIKESPDILESRIVA